jgi:putative DNA primase/helicase
LVQSQAGPPKPWTRKKIDEIIGQVERRTYVDISALNADMEWLACDNCMLNLRTGQTAPFSPSFMNTTCIPVKYSDVYATGPAADFFRLVERRNCNYDNCQCPKIMKFLYDIVEPEDVEILLDFIAYCLWRDYKYAHWLLFNSYGQNGKSVLLNLIELFLGKDNTSAESLERLLKEKFAIANLYQKLANIDADVSGDILINNTGKIKKLTGNDESAAEFKYKQPFKFRNYAKLIFSCNEIPEIQDKTDAFFRRLIIINFTQQFFAEKDDPHILEKLCTEEEFSGLFHELLGRLPRIIRQGIRSTTNETMQETYEKYIRGSNPIQYFVKKALTLTDTSDKDIISKDDMYDSYRSFCRAKKIAAESEQSFSIKMTGIGFQNKQVRRNKKKDYYWIGVKIREWKAVEDSDQQTLTELTDEQLERLKWK